MGASGSASAEASKKAEGFPPPVCLPGLPAFDPVIDIPVLDHRIGPVAGYDDMIENQNPDPIQQPLELKCGLDIFR